VDALIVAAIFVAAAWWGTRYWVASFNAGRQPEFYQRYFEPAVMMACGKGFVVAQPQVPRMADFLNQRIDRFSCSEIPADAQLGTRGMFQGMWRYLFVATAIGWRLLGISWSGMGPLFGVFFAATITVGYGLLRLGMGRAVATFGAFALSVSTLHLLNLPHLRDYSKAPITLALILIIGILVKGRPTRGVLLGCAAAYGLLLGIGYGFRTDFLVNIPVFFFVLFAFVDGGVLKHLKLKLGSAALCLAVFLAVAWPVISVVYRSGGCQWHTALLGLTNRFGDALMIQRAPYDFGEPYLDDFVTATVTSYGRRLHPGIGPVEYCSHEYDRVTGEYLMEIVRRFPADMLTRAYASMAQVAELPFPWFDAPLPGMAPAIYKPRLVLLKALKSSALIWIAGALVLASAVSVRLGLFLGFFLLYFGGYPALQFQPRHHFHLEIIEWWAFGFVIHQLAAAAVARWQGSRPAADVPRPDWRQAGRVLLVMLATCILTLLALRAYQQWTLRRFFERYLSAPVEELRFDPAPRGLTRVLSPTQVADERSGENFLVVALNAWQCTDQLSVTVTVRYDGTFPTEDFSRTLTVVRRSPIPEPTRIFIPVYRHVVGLEFSDSHPGCVAGVARVRDLTPFTLLLPSILPPRWDHAPLYQQIR